MLDFHCVGETGFEPATPCSQSRCANRTALHPVCFLLPLLPPSLQVGGAVCVPKQPPAVCCIMPLPSAALCRCQPLPTTGPSLPTVDRRHWPLAAALAGRASFGSPGCKDNGFFGAHQLFASKSFSGPKGHHRRRNRRRGGIVARRGHHRRMARRPEARRIAALPLPRRHCSPEDRRRRDRPPSGIASGGASHFCSRPSKLPARRSCPLSRQPVEAARYRSGPSRLPAIAADRRTGG